MKYTNKIYPHFLILKLKKLPLIYKLFSKVITFLLNIYTLILTPLIFIEALFFIILNFKKVISNKKVLIISHWSFGHQILGLEYSSRYYYPDKITLIQILYPRNNPYLSQCYQNINTLNFKTIFFKNKNKIQGKIQKNIITFYLGIINLLNYEIEVIDHLNLYNKINFQIHNPKMYNKKYDKVIELDYNLSGLKKLFNDNQYPKPRLPANLKEKIEKQILSIYPNFLAKPFVCFLLRKKRSLEYYDNLRDCGPEKNYVKSIKEFVSRGFGVVSTGEVNDKDFEKIDGYYSFKNINLDYYLLNLYFILNTKILICQHSGPIYLTNSIKTQNILINTFPFFNGTLSNTDKTLFIKLKKNNIVIPTDEIFNRQENEMVLFGKCLEKDGYTLQNCTENEIFNAIFDNNFYDILDNKDTIIGQFKNNKICKHDNFIK